MAKHKSKRSKRSSAFGSVGNIVKTVLIAFGAGSVGALIADRTGVNPMIPSAAVGYVGGGLMGAVAALLVPFLTRSIGTGASQQAQIGQVVWT